MSKEELIRQRFLSVTRRYLDCHQDRDLTIQQLKSACGAVVERKSRSRLSTRNNRSSSASLVYNKKLVLILLLPLLYTLVFDYSLGLDFLLRHYMQESRCVLPNNYLVWEFTRPVSNCDFCRGVDSALVLGNLSRDEFQPYAYSSKPMIVRGAASHWLAAKVFSLQFFRSVYDSIPGAYESIDEDGQFLHFRSDFNSLREVFDMSERRAMNLPGEEPWYIGWKNCHPQVMDILKKFYQPPHFLPEDAEMPNSNYIFLGYEEGADMHVSWIWQKSMCHRMDMMIIRNCFYCSWITFQD